MFQDFKSLVLKNRSYRRFDQNHIISMDDLYEIASLGQIVPSTVNSQPLKFMLINSTEDNALVYDTLGWAGLLRDWNGPEEGERPSAYIILLGDLSIGKNKFTDDGIVAQTMLLGAVSKGLGGCILGNIKRASLAQSLGIDLEKFSIDLVLALGKPAEEIVLEPVSEHHGTHYYRDEAQVHHVPKRSLEELILKRS